MDRQTDGIVVGGLLLAVTVLANSNPFLAALAGIVWFVAFRPEVLSGLVEQTKQLTDETAKAVKVLLPAREEECHRSSYNNISVEPPVTPVKAEQPRQPAKPTPARVAYPPSSLLNLAEKPTALSVPIGVDHTGQFRWLDVQRDLVHCAVYGTSGAGKDHLLRCWYLSLADQRSIRWAIVDGKGDWLVPSIVEDERNLFPPAGGFGDEGTARIKDGLKEILREAARRASLIIGAGVRSLEEYNEQTGANEPLLIVLITDVIDAVVEVEKTLTALISKARSLGIRVIVSMQTPTGFSMQWRMNVGTVLAGALVDTSQDAVALGIRDTAKLPFRPSTLPPPPAGAGLFVFRQGGDVRLIRTPMLTTTGPQSIVFDRMVRERRNVALLGELLSQEISTR